MAESSQQCMGFTLKEKLGYGAFSFARKGVNSKGQEAALKFTKYSKGSEGSKKRQRQEINTELSVFKNIKHPNVMCMYDYSASFMYKHEESGETSECYVMALELASGGELFDLIYYTGALDEKLSRTFFKQIVDGIEAMHLKSLAHRDIKPQNVLLTSDFQIKIADFGSSKRFRSDQLMKTSRVGTRGYQAPELLLQRGYTTKCDIFSLGVLLFVSLTKHPPFKQAIQEDPWFRQIAKKDYKNFWRKHPKDKLSPHCCELIVKMLCYQPLDRYTIQQTKKHPWLQQEVYSPSELATVLTERMKKAARARGADGVRAPDKFNSVNARSSSAAIAPPTINPIQKLYAIECETHPWSVISWIQNELEVKQKLCKAELDEPAVRVVLTTQVTEEIKGMKNMYKKGEADYKTDTTFVTDIEIEVQGYCENWNQDEETAEKYYIHVKVSDGMAVYMADETNTEQLDFYETVMNVMKMGIQEVAAEEEVAAAGN